MMRCSWVEREGELTMGHECLLAGVSRVTVYVHSRPVETDEAVWLLVSPSKRRRHFLSTRAS